MLDLLLGPSVVSELESVVPLLLESSLVSDTVTNSGDESSPPHNLEGVRKKKEGGEEGEKGGRKRGRSQLSISLSKSGWGLLVWIRWSWRLRDRRERSVCSR